MGPRDTVLSQYPKAGEKAITGAHVDLVLATGLSVMIPDIIGLPLAKALKLLDEAGLESDPKIMFNPSKDQPENFIIQVTPEPRTYITPNATVVLEVSSG